MTGLGAGLAERARARRQERIDFDRSAKLQREQQKLAEPAPDAGPGSTGSGSPEPVPVRDESPEGFSVMGFLRGLGVVVGLLLVYLALTAWQVWAEAGEELPADLGTADAIVVLGAAQYDGEPSPVLRGRLDTAVQLWQDGAAPTIVTTGSLQEGDRFTEGFAGYDYLRGQGVPEDSILIDVNGSNTYEQLTSAQAILSDRDLDSVFLVSDSYHAMRLRGMAAEIDLDATVYSTDHEPRVEELMRETAAVSVGRLIGYRRLSNLRN